MAEGSQKYLPLFLAESREALEQLNGELVRLEQEPPGGLWDAIFRRVHSIKGSAATIGLNGIVEIAHAAETLIGKLKAQNQKPERAQINLLLEARDALSREVQRASEGQGENSLLVSRLADASRAVAEPEKPAAVVKPAERPVADPALPRLDVFVTLTKGCQAPGARALIVQRKLNSLGTVLDLEPTPQQLMQKKGGVRLVALLATARSSEEVREAVEGVPDVETVEVRLAPLSAAPSPEVTPLQGALRPVTDTVPQEDPRAEATVRVRAEALDQLLDQAAEVLHGIARLREAARKLPEHAASAFEAEIDRLRVARPGDERAPDAVLVVDRALAPLGARAVAPAGQGSGSRGAGRRGGA